MYLHHLE